jgi:beta-galactosidase/beta-glucuronidase
LAHQNEIDLGGMWRFRLDPEQLGEHYPEQLDIPWKFDSRWMDQAHDERDWAQLRVPSCWQEEGYAYNGAAWYRTRFPAPFDPVSGKRAWLRFEGVDYYADAWLNGRYLGSHEGYFSAFEFEVSPYLQTASNLLAVRVEAPNDIRAREAQQGQLKGMLKAPCSVGM